MKSCCSGRFKRGANSEEFPLVDRLVSRCEGPIPWAQPAPAAADPIVADRGKRVMEKGQPASSGFVHFTEGLPPVIMVAADEDFLPWQLTDGAKVRQSGFELHGPRNITGQEHGVVRSDSVQPVSFDFLPVITPVAAEHVHRLDWGIAGEMSIADCKYFHALIVPGIGLSYNPFGRRVGQSRTSKQNGE